MSRDGILAKNNEFDHRSWVRSPKKVLKKSSEISEAEMRFRTSVEKGLYNYKTANFGSFDPKIPTPFTVVHRGR